MSSPALYGITLDGTAVRIPASFAGDPKTLVPGDVKYVEAPGGRKSDDGKARWDLLPLDALEDVAQVLRYGAEKYAERNWERGLSWGRLLAAAFRHLAAWACGQNRDAESGHHHLAHAAACVLMLLSLVKRGRGTDDRSPFAGPSTEGQP